MPYNDERWRKAREKTKHLLNCEQCGIPWKDCRCLTGMGVHITAHQDTTGIVIRSYVMDGTVILEHHSPDGRFDTMVLSDDALTQMTYDWMEHLQPDSCELPRYKSDEMTVNSIVDAIMEDGQSIGTTPIDEWVTTQRIRWIAAGRAELWMKWRTFVAKDAQEIYQRLLSRNITGDQMRRTIHHLLASDDLPFYINAKYDTVVRLWKAIWSNEYSEEVQHG